MNGVGSADELKFESGELRVESGELLKHCPLLKGEGDRLRWRGAKSFQFSVRSCGIVGSLV